VKKGAKIIGIVLVIIIIAFVTLAVLGDKDKKEEEQIAETNINDEIAFEGNISDIDFTNDWTNKHIVVVGKVNRVGTSYCTLYNDDFEVKAYCNEIPQNVSVNCVVTIDGVCTYQSSDSLRMRKCKIISVIQSDEKETVEETVTDEIMDYQIETNVDDEMADYQSDTSDETKEDIVETQIDIVIDTEWYKKNSLFINDNGDDELEFIWYDDIGFDIAINDTSMYYFESDKYDVTSEGNILYTSDDGTSFVYFPNDEYIELKSGEYQGKYVLLNSDMSNDIKTDTDNTFSYAEDIALNYSVNGKTIYSIIRNGHYDNYDVSNNVTLVNNVAVNNISVTFWYKNSKGLSTSSIIMFHVSGGEAVPYAMSEGSSTWTDNLDNRIEKLIDNLTN
jgi:hypothetical protein